MNRGCFFLCAYRRRRRGRARLDERSPRVSIKRPELVCDEEQQRTAAEGRKLRFECDVSILRDEGVSGGPHHRTVCCTVRPPRACGVMQ